MLTSFKVELINLQRSPQRTCQGCYPSINETAPSMASLLLQLIQDSWQFRVDSNLKHVLQNAKCSLPLASGLLQMLKSSLHPVANLCNSGKYSIIMFESVLTTRSLSGPTSLLFGHSISYYIISQKELCKWTTLYKSIVSIILYQNVLDPSQTHSYANAIHNEGCRIELGKICWDLLGC